MSLPKIYTADIYGQEDEVQTMLFEMEFVTISSMFDFKIRVNYIKFKLPLLITPSDLIVDLELALCEHFEVEFNDLRIDCEVQYCNTETPVTI